LWLYWLYSKIAGFEPLGSPTYTECPGEWWWGSHMGLVWQYV
jgi:hypothetical protein